MPDAPIAPHAGRDGPLVRTTLDALIGRVDRARRLEQLDAELAAERDAVTALRGLANGGAGALAELARLEDATARPERVSRAALARARADLDPKARRVLERVVARHLVFARRQARALREFQFTTAGVTLGQSVVATRRLGLVLPGGTAGPAVGLAAVCLARAAGAREVVVAAPPPGATEERPVGTLAAVVVAGASEVRTVGGAAAVADLALGVLGPAVDRIVVLAGEPETLAMARAVARLLPCWIADPRAPSLFVAGARARPELVAADLLADREQCPDRPRIVVATDAAFLEQLEAILREGDDEGGAPGPVADAAVVADRRAALEAVDAIGPGRVALHIEDAHRERRRLRDAGAIHAGALTTPALADLGLGLPPSALGAPSAQSAATLSVLDLVSLRSFASVDRRGFTHARSLGDAFGVLTDARSARAAIAARGGPRRVRRAVLDDALRRDRGLRDDER